MKKFVVLTLLIIACQFIIAQSETYAPNTPGIKRNYVIKLPFEKTAKTVEVDVINNLVLLEGDMILGSLVEFEGEAAVAIDGENRRWPNGIIPFVIATDHPRRSEILQAIEMVNENTVLCVRPRASEADHIRFISGGGCASFVGKRGGMQEITIGNCGVGSIAHEILHAAGLFHEQSREDRNGFIRVNTANIEPGREHNFNQHIADATDIGAYNYGSLMHYGPTAFSRNGLNTIDVLVPPGTAGTVIGQRTSISVGDRNAIRTIYPTAKGCACNNVSKDCVAYNPARIKAKKISGRWKVVDGNHWLFDTENNRSEARRIAKIIKFYMTNGLCFVGRPDASFTYLTKNGQAPVGAISGEDCISFNPSKLEVQRVNGNWTIVEKPSHLMYSFGNNEIEARTALCLILEYGFTKSCYVGRPGPSLSYLRK